MSSRVLASTAKTAVSAVASVNAGVLQRQCACGQHTVAGGECEECSENKRPSLQRRANNHDEPGPVPPIVHEILRSPGQPLDVATRAFVEPRLGHDFSQVRVHADSRAGESAAAIGASAYAFGNDLVFGTGRYSPTTPAGRLLLAHELIHVVQQNRSGAEPSITPMAMSRRGDASEQEAESLAHRVVAGEPAQVRQSAAGQVQGFGTAATVGVAAGVAAVTAGLAFLASKLADDDATVIDNPPKCGDRQNKKIDAAAKEAAARVTKALVRFRAFAFGNNPKAADYEAVQTRVDARFGKDASTNPEVLRKIDRVVGRIASSLSSPSFKRECHDTKTDNLCAQMAQAYVSNYGNAITFCPSFFSTGDPAAPLVHELAHTLMGGPAAIKDRGYRSERITPLLSTEEALTNAESYAELVVDLAVGTIPSSAPKDVIGETCPQDWQAPISVAIAKAERWNTSALSSASNTDIKKVADVDAMKAYKAAFGKLSGPVEFQCRPKGGDECDKAPVYWAAPASPMFLCPAWKTKTPTEQVISLLDAIYGNFAGVEDATKRAEYANNAYQVTQSMHAVPSHDELFGSSKWSSERINFLFNVMQPIAAIYYQSATSHQRLSDALPVYRGPECSSSNLPFACKAMFFVDSQDTPRPAPFRPPRLAMRFSFKSLVPSAGFEWAQNDNSPVYQGPGHALETSFTPAKFFFDKNGTLGIEVVQEDPEAGVVLTYEDSMRIEAERPCPQQDAPAEKK